MENTVLLTKLFIPKLPAQAIKRPHIIQNLEERLQRGVSLTLISAPAGYGKSTLLAEWIATYQHQVAWISLDNHDNDPQRFWLYCVTAFQTIVSELEKQELMDLVESLKHEDPRDFLTSLVNLIVSWDRQIILVLDDYHMISSKVIHEGVEFLIGHIPNSLHLIIATRTDPPLQLSRLRVRGQLTEIRIVDLRFTINEAGEFLNNRMQLGLNEEDVSALEARTEGWIAGLYLAAMSMQGLDDIHGFVQDFTGSQFLVLEYLVDEVLQQQQETVQRLLLETSILQRMCAPLCDAITGSVESERLLADLYRRNLFIIPLDGEHYWFRYHHLFAEFLKSHLKRSQSCDIPELHRRASVWYQTHGYPEEALFHALAIPDYTYVSRLVVDNWRMVYHTGNLYTAKKWLESLPGNILRKSPPLGVAYCWTLFIRGDHVRIETFLDDIELEFKQMVDQGVLPCGHPEYQIIMHQVILLRAIVMRHAGNVAAAIKTIEDLLPSIEDLRDKLGQRFADMGFTACYSQLGYMYATVNELDLAEEYLGRVSSHARECGNYFALAHATMEWVRINVMRKQLARAEDICRRELLYAKQAGIAEYPAFCLIQLALADTLRAKGSWDESENLLAMGLKTAKRNGHEFYLAQGYLIAARLHHALGKTHLVAEDMFEAAQIAISIHNRFLDDSLKHTRNEIQGTRQNNGSILVQQLIEPLSNREIEVLRLICQGKSNQEIANELFVSLNTIKRHTNNIFGKMGVTRRAQAIHEALRFGIL